MKILKKKFSGLIKNKSGQALLWVTFAFVIVTITSMAMISVAVGAVSRAQNERCSQQAYYTAKSVASTVATYIENNTQNQSAIDELLTKKGSVKNINSSFGNSKDVSVDASYVEGSNNNIIKVTATAKYGSAKKTVTAYLKRNLVQPGLPDAGVYCNSDANIGSDCIISGTLGVGGSGVNAEGLKVGGDLFAGGSISIGGQGSIVKGAVLGFGGKDTGISLQNTTVDGSISSTGDLTLLNGNTIGRGANVAGTVTSDGNQNINGIINAAGGVPSGQNYKHTKTLSIDLTQVHATLSRITAPPQAPNNWFGQNADSYRVITYLDGTLVGCGRLTDSVVETMRAVAKANPDKDNKIIINTDDPNLSNYKAINIIIRSDDKPDGNSNTLRTVDLENLDIRVVGSKNVYIYLIGNVKLLLGGNTYLGMNATNSNPQLFIFGTRWNPFHIDEDKIMQTVEVDGTATLNACVYMPFGNFVCHVPDESKNPSETFLPKLAGSLFVNHADIHNNCSILNLPSNLKGTPLDSWAFGFKATYGPWQVQSWDNQ